MRKKKVGFMIMLSILLILAGCGNHEKDAESELYISAAASMTDVLTEIGEVYQKKEDGVKLVFNFDSSGTLKTQIEQGAPADVFISAAEKQMEELRKGGFMSEGTVVNLLKNQVVLIQPKNSKLKLEAFEDVLSDEVSMIAIGGSDVPVGAYTERIYTNLGIWSRVQEKANLAANVRQVLDWVATENADCGIVYATDAAVEDDVKVVCTASEAVCGPVVYPAGVVKGSGHTEEAEAFLSYLKSKEAREIFEKYGFQNYEE